MLSILTNFGCHFGCSYCVYRDNGIQIPRTFLKTFGWNQLEEELKQRKGETISISGGGDPLYEYSKTYNMEFYDKLFELLDKYDCKVELHTSILNSDFPYDLCERVVFHLNMPTQINMLLERDRNFCPFPDNVRVVFVVQEHYTKHLIDEIIKEIDDDITYEITELSFRQMIDKNGQPCYYLHDYLKAGHGDRWYYIEQADYNEYFVNDHIEREYLKIKGDK